MQSTPSAYEKGEVSITSGGGFSTFFAQPSWQQVAVDEYFASLDEPPWPGYNRNGRGIPDVALLGVTYMVWFEHHLLSTSRMLPYPITMIVCCLGLF